MKQISVIPKSLLVWTYFCDAPLNTDTRQFFYILSIDSELIFNDRTYTSDHIPSYCIFPFETRQTTRQIALMALLNDRKHPLLLRVFSHFFSPHDLSHISEAAAYQSVQVVSPPKFILWSIWCFLAWYILLDWKLAAGRPIGRRAWRQQLRAQQ